MLQVTSCQGEGQSNMQVGGTNQTQHGLTLGGMELLQITRIQKIGVCQVIIAHSIQVFPFEYVGFSNKQRVIRILLFVTAVFIAAFLTI